MRSSCTALVLLMTYLVLVFLAFRVLDLVTWLQHGVSTTQIVDPILLSVRQLKQLLEVRGVSYTGYVEKQELAKLVEASADVVQGEIDELNEVGTAGGSERERERLTKPPKPSFFTGAAHFYEEVEDTKDSVWLVQVVPPTMPSDEPLLDDYTWTVVRTHVAPFDIRTGVFYCKLDRRLCNTKGWHKPLLLLALPRGTKPKDRVIMRTCELTRPQAIIEWLREELSIRVKKIPTYEELENEWLNTSNNSSSEVSKTVKVLLLTHLLHPPLFLAALSIKFTGRITFGIFSVKKDDSQKIEKVPTYLVITPEKTIVYGRRNMEHFNLNSMNAFLKAIQPEMNDIFLCSLLLVNMFTVLYVIQMAIESWMRFLIEGFCNIIVCNLILFALWLILLGTMRWPTLSVFGDWWISIIRRVALSDFGSLVRSDWIRLTGSPLILLSSLISFGIVAGKRVKQNPSFTSDRRSWWEMDCLFRPPATSLTQPIPMPEIELEEGIEMLIERLAVPNFWLQPVISLDYIKDLFVWKYQGPKCVKRDSPEIIRKIMDSDDDKFVTRLSHSRSHVKLTDSKQKDCVIKTTDCAICLDKYRYGTLLCALPCGHNYHQKCIMVWLQRDNHHCPICRWPAYKVKRKNSL